MTDLNDDRLVAVEHSELQYDLGFWEGLRPDPILSVSEWADSHRVLAQVSSAMPGRWKTSRTPYLREIQDALSVTSSVQEVVFIKGAQIGGTEAGNNWLAYLVDSAPGPMMLVMPTIDTAKKVSKTRIRPLIENCDRLKNKFPSTKSRDGGNTLLMKEFPGGVLILSGANSAVSLRSQPIRFLMLDEIDGYPMDVDGEGDPVALAEARTRTYLRRKIFKVSTPTIEGKSKISDAWDESDKRHYHVPCPHCQGFQWLKWSQVKWPTDEPLKAYYVCELCQKPILERHKTWMLANGKWVAEKPGAAAGKVIGFHLSALYSNFGSFTWGDAARQWVRAQGKSDKLREFVNTVLGETWKEKGIAPEWELLYQRREKYAIGSVHDRVVFLTAGVDVQKDRLEVEIVGWAQGKQSWSIEYLVFDGDTALAAKEEGSPWAEVDKLLSRTWKKGNGLGLPIRKLAVDTGYNTQHVYTWARGHSIQKVMAVKGSDSLSIPLGLATALDVKSSGKRVRRGIRVWPMGSSVIKGELYSWLNLHPPTDAELAAGKDYKHGYCHFPEYGEEFFKQMTAEQLVVKLVKNRKNNHRRKYEWEKTRERNEVLDCRVMSRAAAAAIGMDRFTDEDWLDLAGDTGISVPARKIEDQQPPKPVTEPQRPRSKFSFGRDR